MNINFYLDNRTNKEGKSKIFLFISFNGARVSIFTGEKCDPANWQKKKQRLSRKERYADLINRMLDFQESLVRGIFNEARMQGLEITKDYLKVEFNKVLNASKANKNTENTFFSYFQQFIEESEKGERRSADGKRLSKGTIQRYHVVLKRLQSFQAKKKYFVAYDTMSPDFYTKFTDYMWYDLGLHDNTVGSNVKVLKAFLNWSVSKGFTDTKEHKERYFKVWKEQKDIIVLNPSMLNMLIDANITDSRLDRVRDRFVIGCTTALRISDLNALQRNHLIIDGDRYKLRIRTRKTGSEVLLDLPEHAKKIIDKYWDQYDTLLPEISEQKFNDYLKELGVLMGWDKKIVTVRKYKAGESEEMTCSFAELLTSHVMRRTGITTLLILGMDEISVKRISGHSMNSKDFYKYVLFSQQYINNQYIDAWDKLRKGAQGNGSIMNVS